MRNSDRVWCSVDSAGDPAYPPQPTMFFVSFQFTCFPFPHECSAVNTSVQPCQQSGEEYLLMSLQCRRHQENAFSLLSAKLFSVISPTKSGHLGLLLLIRTLRSGHLAFGSALLCTSGCFWCFWSTLKVIGGFPDETRYLPGRP